MTWAIAVQRLTGRYYHQLGSVPAGCQTFIMNKKLGDHIDIVWHSFPSKQHR